MSPINWIDQINRYFWFTGPELRDFIITLLVLAFIFSFTDWGQTTFNAGEGFSNLGLALIIAGISVFAHHAGQRLLAIKYGFKPEHLLWKQGLILSTILTVFSNGAIRLLPGMGFMIHHLPIHRIGFYRYGPGFKTFGTITAIGPFCNLLLAAISYALTNTLPLHEFFTKLTTFNLLFAAYNLLPFPPLDGSRIFYASRLLYVFMGTFITSYAFFALAFDVYSLLLAFSIAIITWISFYYLFERYSFV